MLKFILFKFFLSKASWFGILRREFEMFGRSEEVASYMGLTPSDYSTGDYFPVFLLICIFASLAKDETKTFIEEYTYQGGEVDSKLSSRVIALEQVKSPLLEKLGAYLESETEPKRAFSILPTEEAVGIVPFFRWIEVQAV